MALVKAEGEAGMQLLAELSGLPAGLPPAVWGDPNEHDGGGVSGAPGAAPQLPLPVPADVEQPPVHAASAAGPAATSHIFDEASLPFDEVHRMLTDEAEPCAGTRPDYMLGEEFRGRWPDNEQPRGSIVFKELHHAAVGGKKRRRGTDKWQRQDGKKGHADHRIAATGNLVRRSYSTVTLMQAPTQTSGATEVGKLRYHEYKIQDAANPDHERFRLYHVFFPDPDTPSEVDLDRNHRTDSDVQTGLLRLQLPESAADRLLGRGRQGGGRWVQFENAEGRTMGSIEQNPQGHAMLSTPAGDFAEWHPRMPGEAPFEEGDVVGMVEMQMRQMLQLQQRLQRQTGDSGAEQVGTLHQLYISRRTHNALAVGVITRRAAVAGSAPSQSQDRELFDTVAYIGRVPIKVRGDVTAGQMLMPSGYEDGTAVAVSAPCSSFCRRRLRLGSESGSETARRVIGGCCSRSMRLGRAEYSASSGSTTTNGSSSSLEMELLSDTSREWQRVQCVVVNPSQTVDSSALMSCGHLHNDYGSLVWVCFMLLSHALCVVAGGICTLGLYAHDDGTVSDLGYDDGSGCECDL
jgi:hypothetical protein